MIERYITPNDTIRENDSASIQAAVDLAKSEGLNKVVIPRINLRTNEAKWVISETVKLPSDMTVVLSDSFMQMADDVVGGFFKSETLFTPDGTSPEKRMRNIHIIGEGRAVLDGGKPTELNEETQKALGVPVRLNTPIFFMNVERFSVENIEILHQRYWGMRFEFCSKGVIRDIYIEVIKDRRNQDGINLRNGCHDILIENVSGQSGDDLIALSAIDTDLPTGFGESGNDYSVIVEGMDWDIHDITIRNIWGSPITHPLVALRNHNGAKIYNIHMENLHDTASIRKGMDSDRERYAMVHIGDNIYYRISRQVMGDTHNITVKDVYLNHTVAAVQVGGTVKNMSVSNVHAAGECRAILTVVGDNWGDDVYGVKMDGVDVDGVYMVASGDDSSVVDLPFMMEGDYVKGLSVRNAHLENVDRLALVHENCAEFDISTQNIRLTNSSDKIEYTDRKIKIKRAERNLPPFKSTVKREDI
jgi:polygalacturonase